MSNELSETDAVALAVLEIVNAAKRVDALEDDEALQAAKADGEDNLLWIATPRATHHVSAEGVAEPISTKQQLKAILRWGAYNGHAGAALALVDGHQEHMAELQEFIRWAREESELEPRLEYALYERRRRLEESTSAVVDIGLSIDVGLTFAATLGVTTGGGEIDDVVMADDLDAQRKQWGLDLWNGGKTWSEVAEALDGMAGACNAVREEIKRFAKATQQEIRIGRPGAKRRGNLNE